MDEHVIHIDDQPPFVDKILEGMVHIGLKSGWGVAKSKEHDGGFKKSERSREGCFPPVFRLDEDVVVTPSYVEFGEDFAIFKFIHQF